jgi:hypothetical protein
MEHHILLLPVEIEGFIRLLSLVVPGGFSPSSGDKRGIRIQGGLFLRIPLLSIGNNLGWKLLKSLQAFWGISQIVNPLPESAGRRKSLFSSPFHTEMPFQFLMQGAKNSIFPEILHVIATGISQGVEANRCHHMISILESSMRAHIQGLSGFIDSCRVGKLQ